MSSENGKIRSINNGGGENLSKNGRKTKKDCSFKKEPFRQLTGSALPVSSAWRHLALPSPGDSDVCRVWLYCRAQVAPIRWLCWLRRGLPFWGQLIRCDAKGGRLIPGFSRHGHTVLPLVFNPVHILLADPFFSFVGWGEMGRRGRHGYFRFAVSTICKVLRTQISFIQLNKP